jgi:putative ABC transport system ATP-binding protein
MVTHDPRMAASADRIVFLKDGVIVGEGRPEAGNGHNAEWVAAKMRQLT